MKKRDEIPFFALFLGFLLAMTLGLLLLPKSAFSESEKRYLAQFPAPTVDTVFSGAWGQELETYLADHLPGRKFFVGLNAYYEKLLGQQKTKEIWVVGDRLVEAPVAMDDSGLKKVEAINRFAGNVQQQVQLALVPSCGWAADGPEYQDAEIIRTLYGAARVNTIDLLPVYAGNPEYYYRTDHHWNSLGAYMGYEKIVTALGREPVPQDSFRQEIFPACFQGSTYSRSALWLTEPEDIAIWHGAENITVQNGETEEIHAGVFYRERLEEADKYTVYLDGNHSIVTVCNPEREGKLLVIRDSYSNSLGCFLAESYGQVVLVDLRYYKAPISQLAQQDFDSVLICYSIGNFLTDGNLLLLR